MEKNEDGIYPKGRDTVISVNFNPSSAVYEIDTSNCNYIVWLTEDKIHNIQQLTITRDDNEPVRDWYDIWNIKNHIWGKESNAVEFFPPESSLIDGQNQTHIWRFPHLNTIFNMIDISKK